MYNPIVSYLSSINMFIFQVSITCTVSLADVNCFAGCLSKENNIEDVLVDTDNKSVTVIRNLNIHQKGVTLQVIPLQLTLYYPEIMVEPTTIHFGDVWIGNSSKASFTIYSTSGNHQQNSGIFGCSATNCNLRLFK